MLVTDKSEEELCIALSDFGSGSTLYLKKADGWYQFCPCGAWHGVIRAVPAQRRPLTTQQDWVSVCDRYGYWHKEVFNRCPEQFRTRRMKEEQI